MNFLRMTPKQEKYSKYVSISPSIQNLFLFILILVKQYLHTLERDNGN